MKLGAKRYNTYWLKGWEQQPRLAWSLSILWLLLIAWVAFFWNLGSTGLIDETEPLFAEASRQMTVTGDWITPYFNNATRFDKPILLYWCQALAYTLIGVNSWAVRLPSALSAIALTVLTFYTLRYFGIPNPSLAQKPDTNSPPIKPQLWLSALYGSTMLALNPLTIAWARTGVSDMLLTLGMGGGLLAFFMGYAASTKAVKAGWYSTLYVLIALAILTKGPIGIVLPGVIIGAFLLYLGNAKAVLKEMGLLRGALIIVLIALPWYVLVTLKNGESFINAFFIYHNVERFTSVIDHQDGPWYIYFPILLLGFAPWSIYLPVAIARLRFWELKNWRSQPRSTHLGLFALIWLAIVFIFFSIAVTKRPNYIIPLLPSAAIIVALLWSELLTRFEKSTITKGLLWSAIVNVIFLVVVAGAIFYITEIIGYDPAAPDMRSALEQSGLPVLGGMIFGATGIVAALLLWRRQWHRLWSANIIGFLAALIFVVMPANSLMDEVRQLPLRELSAKAMQVQQPGEELIMIGFEKPSVVFYTQEHVNFIPTTQKAENYIEANTTTNSNSHSLLIISRPDLLEKTGLKPDQYQILGKSGGYELIRILRK